MPDAGATDPGLGNYISQGPFLSRRTSRKVGQDRGHPPRASPRPPPGHLPSRGARTRRTGPPHVFLKFLRPWEPSRPTWVPDCITNLTQYLYPARKELPPPPATAPPLKGTKGLKQFLPVEPFRHVHLWEVQWLISFLFLSSPSVLSQES